MKLQLIEDARALWTKLWSVRLALLAALLAAIDAGLGLYFDGRYWPALVSMFFSLGAAVARLVAQPKAKRQAAVATLQRELDQEDDQATR